MQQKFAKLSEIQGAASVLVVLLEQPVQPPEVIGGLRKAFLHSLGNVSPFPEGDGHTLRVFAFLIGKCSEKMNQMIRNIVLNRRTVTNRINRPKWRSVDAEVCVCLKSMLIRLNVKFI